MESPVKENSDIVYLNNENGKENPTATMITTTTKTKTVTTTTMTTTTTTTAPSLSSSSSSSSSTLPNTFQTSTSQPSLPKRSSSVFSSPKRSSSSPAVEPLKITPTTKKGKIFVEIETFEPKFDNHSNRSIYLELVVGGETKTTQTYDSKSVINIKESYIIPTVGDFHFKIEAFKIKGKEKESIGVTEFESGTLSYPMRKVPYFLILKKQQTQHKVTVCLTSRLDEEDEFTSQHEPNHKGEISLLGADLYSWVLYEGHLRGRNLFLIVDKKKEKTVVIDRNSTVEKAKSKDGEQMWPYHCFEIISNGSSTYLKANTSDEMDIWMKKLKEAASSVF